MLTLISSALEEIEGRPDQGAGGRLAATGVTPVAFREQCGSLSQGRPRQGLQTSASALRATAPDPGPDHTQDKMQSPQHGPARAVLPVSPHLVPLCPCSGWPLSWPGCLGPGPGLSQPQGLCTCCPTLPSSLRSQLGCLFPRQIFLVKVLPVPLSHHSPSYIL